MKISRLAAILLITLTFLACFSTASAAVVFDQPPPNEDHIGFIMNKPFYTSISCALSLHCDVGGVKIYNFGIWIKRVGNPEDLYMQVVSDWNSTTSPSTVSNTIKANSISDSEYKLTWFYFPEGVVMSDWHNNDQFFQIMSASTTQPWGDFNNYYSSLQHQSDDFTAQTQWCENIRGCYSSPFYFRLDDGQTDLSKPASNVLFLPGLEGSRLYEQSSGVETRLWEPALLAPLDDLHLDSSGKSVKPGIYTRDVIDEAYAPIVGPNIYKSFQNELEKMKSTDHSINDYSMIPYDWRLSLQDILNSGKVSGGNISYTEATSSPYIIQELRRLAASSKSGKVTIIAHSNGGLVAKALLKNLEDSNDPLLGSIDKVIFVAVPHLGTPTAITSLLHGYDENIPSSFAPFLFSPKDARELGVNAPVAYNLLPDSNYFTYVDTPVVTFDPALTDWISKYGNTIHSTDRLENFLTDTYGRVSATSADTDKPIALLDTLFTNAQDEHTALDNLTIPAGIQVIDIAGWGIPKTVSGIHYVKPEECPNGICALVPDPIKPEPTFTIDGDGTVVTPSALWSNGGDVKRYWLNLKTYNIFSNRVRDGHLLALGHSDILEIPELNNFIVDLLSSSTKPISQYTYFSTSVPDSSDTRLIYALHSPLTLDIYDNLGNHTGVSTTTGQIEEQIPGTYYMQFGEQKYIFTDTGTPTHVSMSSYATGTFTFNIQQLQGDTLMASTTFKDIPTSTTTKVKLDVSNDINTVSNMNIDTNGDGITDLTLTPKLNDSVTIPTISSKKPLIITGEDKIIILGSSIPNLTYTIAGFVNGDSATSSVSGTANCSTTAINSSSIGSYPITCSLGSLTSNSYSFATFTPATLHIVYRWDGFLQPINDTKLNPTQSPSVSKAGSTVPVKFQLKKSNGTIVQAGVVPVWLSPQQVGIMSSSVNESIDSDPGTSGNVYKWDSGSQQYIYNWSTKGLSAGYWYKVFAKLDDGTVQSVIVGLR